MIIRRVGITLPFNARTTCRVHDKISDVAAGHAMGAATVLVLSGYGRGEWEHRRSGWPLEPDHVAEDLLDAVEWALEPARAGAH